VPSQHDPFLAASSPILPGLTLSTPAQVLGTHKDKADDVAPHRTERVSESTGKLQTDAKKVNLDDEEEDDENGDDKEPPVVRVGTKERPPGTNKGTAQTARQPLNSDDWGSCSRADSL
jgi:hypothetical protein